MDSQQPKRSSSPFEYFLYVAILAETALAALIYKVIFRSAELAHLRVYFAIFYFTFLAWAVAQLNMLHRDRTSQPEQPESPPLLAPETEPVPREHTRSPFGLSGVQL